MKTHYLKKDAPWPEAVSDGLVSSCEECGVVPIIDYLVSNEVWENTVPRKIRSRVVCLECLINMNPDVIASIKKIFVCNGGQTICLKPTDLYHYRWEKED